MKNISFPLKLIAGVLLSLAAFFVALSFGAADVSLRDVWGALFSSPTNEDMLIIRENRLPREVGAFFVGAALAVAGAIMQGLTRNPLADPGLLGLTAGANAALAAAMAFIPGANYVVIIIACFIGAAIGAGLVFGIGSLRLGGLSPVKVVLAGAAVSALLYAVSEAIGLSFELSKQVSAWTAGGLVGVNWTQLQLVIPILLAGTILSLFLSHQLTLLSLSDEVAVGLGQKTFVIKALLFLVTILLAGASVALVGNMTFIGLMIPHIVRFFAGTDYRYILPLSFFAGGTFMLLADTAARTINAPFETPLVAIVAALGLPFFLFIVHRGGRAYS
ncbi:FecCD family ABC transporter permease [Terribacillus halophilus]|jgi:iron complex transport system permease protein|uniref:FecCD family ABC transporter permease n=1 Tax=Terribacillus halophilus TaxID=361279 RepID=UPI000986F695|nr:iron ABC transporter permease [Terribacillus halophilus]